MMTRDDLLQALHEASEDLDELRAKYRPTYDEKKRMEELATDIDYYHRRLDLS